MLFTYTKRSFTLLLQKTHFSILLHLSSELLINKLFTGEGRAFHHYIHRIAYRKKSLQYFLKIIALIVENIPMFKKEYPNEKNNLLAYSI